MTQVYSSNGTVYPVSVIQAGPCVVTQVKTHKTDGYDSVQLGNLNQKESPFDLVRKTIYQELYV